MVIRSTFLGKMTFYNGFYELKMLVDVKMTFSNVLSPKNVRNHHFNDY